MYLLPALGQMKKMWVRWHCIELNSIMSTFVIFATFNSDKFLQKVIYNIYCGARLSSNKFSSYNYRKKIIYINVSLYWYKDPQKVDFYWCHWERLSLSVGLFPHSRKPWVDDLNLPFKKQVLNDKNKTGLK